MHQSDDFSSMVVLMNAGKCVYSRQIYRTTVLKASSHKQSGEFDISNIDATNLIKNIVQHISSYAQTEFQVMSSLTLCAQIWAGNDGEFKEWKMYIVSRIKAACEMRFQVLR